MPVPNQPISVIIAEKSSYGRLAIAGLLQETEEFKVLATASNGQEAFGKIQKQPPDVLLTALDLELYDGLFLIRKVMELQPLPVIVLSNASDKINGNLRTALTTGAYDYIDKPSGGSSSQYSILRHSLKKKLKEAVQQSVPEQKNSGQFAALQLKGKPPKYDILVFGSSTGGTEGVEHLIAALPANFPLPVVIAQHMPKDFLSNYALRLNAMAQVRVKIPTDGEPVLPFVYVAPGNANLEITATKGGSSFTYTQKQFSLHNHPSINCLFISVAEVYRIKSIGVILSWMGKDGIEGIQAIHAAGGYTIAQDNRSSIIDGMPKFARESGAIHQVMPSNSMAEFIFALLANGPA